ncbi:MAG TPA: c-type cytochrome [Burkholderiales bacterium]|jgi:cytochrome c553|nr:c-type cytochrome [Burkholderiales bacterium]
MNRKLVALAAVGLLWAAQAAAQGTAKPDVAKGESIAKQVCAACHAADGNSAIAANPKLAGQFQEYLHKQLVNFKPQGAKKAERDNAIMAGMVANLSSDDMRNVAAYYAGQKLRPATASSKELASHGQKLWRGGNAANGVPACAGCHGPDGAGIPSQFPRLAGQFAEYVEAQLKLFRAGGRANDASGMMRGVAAKMTDQEIKAVAEYAAGLR